MKKLVLVLVAAAGASWGCSQRLASVQAPSLVQNAVQVKYPGVKTIDWEKQGDLYEAEFEVGMVEHTALLDATGHILMQKQDIGVAELPQPVALALQRDYQAYQKEDLEKVEKAGQVYYQVELENPNGDLQKVFAADGSSASLAYWD
ncbi:hypothetical protein [Rufibacter psychrotolerans]|uniref:hypothetical protein n=1 Tax=Rufibacter psychrotolerans TaxID=2812556 RepID=UPI0019689105|nr:hypothetical protein [Rufibacter sp. SYSU D00308]